MIGTTFIATFCAVFATETTKNLAKGGASILYERTKDLFNDELTALNLNGNETCEEIQNRLQENDVIKNSIEKKFQENEDLLDELTKILKESSTNITNNFNSSDNEKVINIGENHGKINM